MSFKISVIAVMGVQLISMISATDTPIIGVLAQEPTITSKEFNIDRFHSYIMAAYIKFLEGSGARVVPIMIGQNEKYYEDMVKNTNGMLFPGGGVEFNASAGYGKAARNIFKYVIGSNKQGIYYPLWGTCLGMEVLLYAELGRDVIVPCSVDHVSLPLHFSTGYASSRLFSKAPVEIIEILKDQNVTLNSHSYCLTRKGVSDSSNWNVLATDLDNNNLEFVTVLEHKYYPIYGTQFHPESNIYQFKQNIGITHTVDAVISAQYFANFIVNEARKNNNSFPDDEQEKRSLIYNYSPLYTGTENSYFVQVYVFDDKQT